jgi:peptidoglycan hydrolase CwlO-like protein
MKKILPIVLIICFLFSSVAMANREDEKKSLEQELAELEAKIREYEIDVTRTEAERESLQYQVNTIRNRINQLNLQIKQSNYTIQQLAGQVKETESSIQMTSLEIQQLQSRLGDIVREAYRQQQKSLLEILLTENTLSGFFYNLTAMERLSQESQNLLAEVKGLKINLEEKIVVLDVEKSDVEKAVRIQQMQAEESKRAQEAQEALLRETQGKEEEYKKMLEDAQREAEKIRAMLFDLAGVPEDDTPTFGKALELARWVQGITNVRPAFLLAILQQESAMGRNVGQCYLPVDPAENQRRRVMAAPPASKRNDVAIFLDITKNLGLDPYKTPISCPMSVGWGGAMGAAQFIPSTWSTYAPRVTKIVGSHANPWNIRDAFLASGLHHSDHGAAGGTKAGEWRAAMIYFSGGTTNSAFFWYADQVLVKADCIQTFIDTNAMSPYCQGLIRLR